MFVDEAKVLVIGGDGGNGCMSFRREKFVPRGGPNGGDGGQGGSVIFEADEGEATLLRFRYRPRFVGARGRHGEGSNKFGRSGEDSVIPVPVGTVVWDEDHTHQLADMSHAGDRFVAAQGGKGGLGNARFKSSVNQAPTKATPGAAGERRTLLLELKLLADVGLLGFPNAGKSTLISRISAARPKIADYPFTTLVPQLGVVDRGDYRTFVVADIPGLIDGAHQGAGLGLRFLRHVERCRLLLHLVDVADTTRDPVDRIESLNRELSGYGAGLEGRPQLIVCTKVDVADETAGLEAVRQWADNRDLPCLEISSVRGDGLSALVQQVGATLDRLTPPQPSGERER